MQAVSLESPELRLVRSPSLSWRRLPIGVYVHDHAVGSSYVLDALGSTMFLQADAPVSEAQLLQSVSDAPNAREVLEGLVMTGLLRKPGERPLRTQAEHSSGDTLIDQLVASNCTRLAMPYAVGIEWLEQRRTRARHLALVGSESNALSTGDWIRVLEDLVRLGTVTLSITGEDALRRGDSLFLLRHARQRGFAVNLFCQATDLQEETADELSSLYLESVWITLRAADPRTHDALTGEPGRFERTVRSIRALVDAGQPVRINGLMPTATPESHAAMRRLATELGCHLVTDPVLLHRSEEHPVAASNGSVRRFSEVNARPSIFLMSDGTVRPCRAFEPLARAVPEESVADIWQTSSSLRQAARLPLTFRPGCRDCLVRSACFG